jgi:hypothetical protein
MNHDERTVARLLDQAGTTYAAEAGITLADKPAPLYRLLVLAVLLSTPINARLATAATAELVRTKLGTADRMDRASWQARVDALGRAHYRRYDESSATALGDGARLVLDQYRGDLRRLRDRADGDPGRVRALLTDFPRVGPVGADIFAREAQAVWPELRPAVDAKVLAGARALDLADEAAAIGSLVEPDRLAVLCAALVRAALDDELAGQVRSG